MSIHDDRVAISLGVNVPDARRTQKAETRASLDRPMAQVDRPTLDRPKAQGAKPLKIGGPEPVTDPETQALIAARARAERMRKGIAQVSSVDQATVRRAETKQLELRVTGRTFLNEKLA